MNAALKPQLLVAPRELSLNGVCRYHIDGHLLCMDVEEIANNRNGDNTSGSLSLEVWALAQPYSGGDFSGYQLASVALGALQGQSCFRQQQFAQPLQSPVEGSWYLVMMLREWGGSSFITRDFINFPQPVKAEYKLTLSLDGMPIIYRGRQ